MKLGAQERARMEEILRGVKGNPSVERMRDFVQHGRVSTYTHCQRVAELCLALNRRLRLRADEEVLLKSAMLHDFYLYDWHVNDPSHRWHGFRHPEWAAENARVILGAGEREQQAIRTHMWPLTLRKLPRTREAWILCLADKWCSLGETLRRGGC